MTREQGSVQFNGSSAFRHHIDPDSPNYTHTHTHRGGRRAVIGQTRPAEADSLVWACDLKRLKEKKGYTNAHSLQRYSAHYLIDSCPQMEKRCEETNQVDRPTAQGGSICNTVKTGGERRRQQPQRGNMQRLVASRRAHVMLH